MLLAPAASSGLKPQQQDPGRDVLPGFERTPLASLFFSRENIEVLQQGIRWCVFSESAGRHVISRQSDNELFIVMRSIFLQRGQNMPHDVITQVRDLNKAVLDYCVPQVLSAIDMYLHFQQDIAQLPAPLERAQLATNKGSRTLERTTLF